MEDIIEPQRDLRHELVTEPLNLLSFHNFVS